jgi:hypothetical protein
MPRRNLRGDLAGGIVTRRILGDYDADIREVDGGWYWHLYYHGERVNGGLAEDWIGALRAARHGASGHERSSMFVPRIRS